MKCSLGIASFFKENSSLSHSTVFLCFFALFTRKDFLTLLAILWNSAFSLVYLSLSPLPFTSLLSSVIYKISSDNHFAFLHFFLWDGLDHCLLYNAVNLCPQFFRHSVYQTSSLESVTSTVGAWFRAYLNGLVVFPTLSNLSLNFAIRSSWSEP